MSKEKNRKFISDEAAVVWLAQRVRPTMMPEYLMWAAIWRKNPGTGRGIPSQPLYGTIDRGAGLFWDIVDPDSAVVQCFAPQGVREQLQQRYESKK